MISLSRLVQSVVDAAADLGRQAGDGLQLLPGRCEQRVSRLEVLHQQALSCRADAGQRVEDRVDLLLSPPLAVESQGEPVRLVANPLEQLQPGRVPGQMD